MQTQRKIKRVQPVLKIKQMAVDAETAVLEQIRAERLRVVQEMKVRQRRYMDGVEQLNQVRASKARTNLDILEQGLDYVKSQWYQLYRSVQELESKERAQVSRVLNAQRDLKAVEKLRERYEGELKKELSKEERKSLDELSIAKFISNKAQTPRT